MVQKLKSWSLVLFFVAMHLPIFTFRIFGSPISINITDINLSFVFQLVVLLVVLFGFIAIKYRPSLMKIADIIVVAMFSIITILMIVIKNPGEGFGGGFLLMIATLLVYAVSAFLPAFADKGAKSVAQLFQKIGSLLEKYLNEPEPQPEPHVEPTQEATPEPQQEVVTDLQEEKI